jgi:hypothetical protein
MTGGELAASKGAGLVMGLEICAQASASNIICHWIPPVSGTAENWDCRRLADLPAPGCAIAGWCHIIARHSEHDIAI